MSRNPFHLVEFSPWPLLGSMGAFILTSGIILLMHTQSFSLLILGLLIILFTMLQWWRDVVRESTLQGLHTKMVYSGLSLGMLLFISSEVLFFFAFFWGYFHSSLSPTLELGSCWPPVGISPLNPFQIPLLNTAVLLASGVTVTWAHHSMLQNQEVGVTQALLLTSVLGVYFTYLQALEYSEASFSISDSVYGTTFFVATGFHGLHVLIGTSFLLVCLKRATSLHFSNNHHFGFEAAAWYWHFVDVVWLFLFLTIYWWGY
uniref:Cytochrome c oxidase subunit 3 n=1 Tax=Bathysciadiidae sp. MNHN-IM-2013-40843 TaxID=2496596 RepID=A0A6B7FLS3_9GAST|nr:cytochrome c oxidase subunit III [Bathysciadiidae sp. MNHN-IM-2013-40843]